MNGAPDERDDDQFLADLVKILFSGAPPSLSPAVPWDPMGWLVED